MLGMQRRQASLTSAEMYFFCCLHVHMLFHLSRDLQIQALCRRVIRNGLPAGEMYFHLVVPLAIGAVALAMLTVALGRNEYAAFIALMVSATSQASNPLEWGYPATYLHGPALSSGWAVANCISAYGGTPNRRTALIITADALLPLCLSPPCHEQC